jgi:hypothetical protein
VRDSLKLAADQLARDRAKAQQQLGELRQLHGRARDMEMRINAMNSGA